MEEEHQCKVCSKNFDRRSRLEAHMKIHSGERPFSCSFCEKTFSSKGNLNTHIRVHTKDRPYECPHCKKCFSQNGQLVIHIRQHTGEKPFSCTECTKKFSCSKVLKIHLRTHTGEKPFTCDHCQKSFAAYANLVVHKRIHTGERPYSCKLCGRKFEHSGNLSRHEKIHTESDSGNFRCIPCGQIFMLSELLLQHSLEMHPNERDEDEDGDIIERPPCISTTDSSLSTVSLDDLHYPDTDNINIIKSTQVSSSGKEVSTGEPEVNSSMRSPLRIRIQIPPKKLKRRVKKQILSLKNKQKKLGTSEWTEELKTCELDSNQSYSLATTSNSETLRHSTDNSPCSQNSEIFSKIDMQSNLLNHKITNSKISHEYRLKRSAVPPPALIPIEERTNSLRPNDDIIPIASGSSGHKLLNIKDDIQSKLKNQLDVIRLNVEDSIQQLLPSINAEDIFKKKVELCLVALIGESKMKELGFPKRTVEQVLIDILDMTDGNPCADVRVDEIDRIKKNFEKFLHFFLPKVAKEKLTGPIDNIIDSVIFSLAKQSRGEKSETDSHPFMLYKKEKFTNNDNT